MLTLINLDSAEERRERMIAQLDALHVPFGRIGVDLRERSLPEIDRWLARELPGIRFDAGALSGAEIGCWASHLCAWKRLLTAGDAAATVIEDDLVLSEDFAAAMRALEAGMPFDLVFLGTSSKNLSARRRTAIGPLHAHAPIGCIFNTWGYTISRRYVERFFAESWYLASPIDHFLGGRARRLKPRIAVLRPPVIAEDPALGRHSQIEPYTKRVDRWRAVESARRRLLASRVSDLYYALYRFL